LPQFLLLPLAPPLLLRIVLLAATPVAAVAIALLLPVGGRVWVWVAAALGLTVLAGIAAGFRIIERSAQGFLHPSQYAQADGSGGSIGGALLLIMLYLAGVALALGVLLVTGGNQTLFWIAWFLLFALAAPAAVLRLAASRSLAAALSPAEIGSTVVSIGLPYFGLCALILVGEVIRSVMVPTLAGAGGLAAALVAGALPGTAAGWGAGMGAGLGLTLFFAGAVYWYVSFVLCALLGYAAYQYAAALDIVVVGPGEGGRGARAAAAGFDLNRRRRDALIARLVADGDLALAIEQINDELRERPSDLSLHARLHQLLLHEGNTARIESHTERCIDLFMRTDNVLETVPLIADVIRRNPHWQPRDPAQVVVLARTALDLGHAHVAVHLIRGFDKKHPRHPELPVVYLIGALAMLKTGGATATAADLLEHVALTYPEHPAAAEALRYLQRLPDGGIEPVAEAPVADAKRASI
jgi:hypothetical protein